MEERYDNAAPEDLHHAACLRIPHSFYNQLPIRGSMVGADRLNVPAIDTFSH